MLNPSALILQFTLYSFLGWLIESIYCSIGQRRLINRGFLTSPLCPIYGFGAFLIIIAARPLADWPPLVFLSALALTSALEYFVSWLLENLFQIRWWDYSHKRFHLKGRVCLLNSTGFGALGLLTVYILFPATQSLLDLLSWEAQRLLASAITLVIFLDTCHTVNSLVNLAEHLQRLQAVFTEMAQYERDRDWFDWTDLSGSITRLRAICAAEQDNEIASLILARLDGLDELKGAGARLAASFPRMQPKGLQNALVHVRDILDERRVQARQLRGRTTAARLRSRAAAALAAGRHAAGFFRGARGQYRLFWVFVAASVLGYATGLALDIVRYGQLIGQQGLIFGAFSLVYGLSAVLMVLLLGGLADRKSPLPVFAGGALVGTACEGLAVLVQRSLFGAVVQGGMTGVAGGLSGPTVLISMIIWGLLAVAFLRHIYPWIISSITRIQRRPLRFITSAAAVFLAVNMLFSAAALSRWESRTRGVGGESAVEQFLDNHFGDDVMELVYPNVQFIR